MAYIDLLSSLHVATKRDYLGRVNDPEFPKAFTATLSKLWGFDYWDGDRRVCYGGYNYIPGRWEGVAKEIVDRYNLKPGSKVLDVGCGKGFQIFELTRVCPGIEVYGLDISEYAIVNAKEEVRDRITLGNATFLPWPENYFDFAFSITTLHNLYNYELDKALREIERVAKKKYVCVESYRNENEKVNLLYWQQTCEAFCTPDEWDWWFKTTGYTGDYSFIYFE